MRSPERPPCPYTTSQSKKGPHYHFHLGLLSADGLPDPHYENPPKVFQSSKKTLTMEGHQPSYDIFYKILSRRLWKNLNQEVNILNITQPLSHYSCLY